MSSDKGGKGDNVVDLMARKSAKGQSTYSISALSREFHLARETVRKRLEGLEPSSRKNGYPTWTIFAAAPRLVDSVVSPSGDFNPELLKPEARDRWYASELKRLQLAREQGDLIPLEEVRREWAAMVKTIVAHLDQIPDRLEQEFGLTPEQVERVERMIDEIRINIHSDLVDDDE